MKENILKIIDILYRLTNTYDPFVIADTLNVDIYFEDLEQKPLGYCSKIIKEPVIVLDQSLIESDLRYLICAHELCHAIRHTDIASYYSIGNITKGKLELEANIFSIELIRNLINQEDEFLSISVKELEKYNLENFLSDLVY